MNKLSGKMSDLLNSVKFWAVTVTAALFILELFAKHTFSLETLFPILQGWSGGVFAVRLLDDFNAKKS